MEVAEYLLHRLYVVVSVLELMEGSLLLGRFVGVREIYSQHELYFGARVHIIQERVPTMLFHLDEFNLTRYESVLGHPDDLPRILHHLCEGHLQLTQHRGSFALAELLHLDLQLSVLIIPELRPGEVEHIPLYE